MKNFKKMSCLIKLLARYNTYKVNKSLSLTFNLSINRCIWMEDRQSIYKLFEIKYPLVPCIKQVKHLRNLNKLKLWEGKTHFYKCSCLIFCIFYKQYDILQMHQNNCLNFFAFSLEHKERLKEVVNKQNYKSELFTYPFCK